MDKYRIYCTTDGKWEYVIANVVPAQCPVSGGHTVKTDSAAIVESDIKVNDGTTTDLSLSDYKQLRYNEIDGKTMALISAGFTYDSHTFSLSIAAQNNWNTLKHSQTDFIWPVDISTVDNNSYSLIQVNLNAFWQAGRDQVKAHLDSGRALKKQIFDAVDEAAVNVVVDNR